MRPLVRWRINAMVGKLWILQCIFNYLCTVIYTTRVCLYVATKRLSKETIMALKGEWFNLTREIFNLRRQNANLENTMEKMNERLEKLEYNRSNKYLKQNFFFINTHFLKLYSFV